MCQFLSHFGNNMLLPTSLPQTLRLSRPLSAQFLSLAEAEYAVLRCIAQDNFMQLQQAQSLQLNCKS